MATAQRIIDLDVVIPETLGVRIEGVVHELPADIPVPDYLAISRDVDELRDLEGEAAAERIEELYERVLELFRIKQPDLEELPIGPRRLGVLALSLYGDLAIEEEPTPPPKPARKPAGTRSTSRKKPTRSRSSK